MELTLWTYEGPPHVGAIRIVASMRDVHLVLHAPQGDTYADLLFTMIEREGCRPPVTWTTFQAVRRAKSYLSHQQRLESRWKSILQLRRRPFRRVLKPLGQVIGLLAVSFSTWFCKSSLIGIWGVQGFPNRPQTGNRFVSFARTRAVLSRTGSFPEICQSVVCRLSSPP